MDRSKIGLLVICLFALPFASFGLFALWKAIEQIATGEGDSPVWLPLLFGILFTAIGVGLVTAVVIGSRRVQLQERVKAEFPGQPWKWRSDWATGRINSDVRSSTIGAWVAAVLWNLASAPLLWIVPHAATQRGPVVLIGLLFPALGIYLVIRALRLNLELRKFGRTHFQMDSVPGVVGRELKGSIHVHFPHPPDHGIQLHLSCVNRVVTGSGKSSSTSENILWRGESTVTAGQLYSGPSDTIIPVTFHIPRDTRPTETLNPRDSICWLLEARADVPGVDYRDTFEVPVFHTEQTPSQAEPESEKENEHAAAVRPEICTVRIRQTSEGTEFYFPAARNKSFAASTTAFASLFGLVTSFIVHMHVPLIFPLVFGLFSLLLLYISLKMWLETTRVTISNSVLTLRDGWLGGGKPRPIPLTEISGIDSRIRAQQGGGTGTAYYDIELTERDNRTVTLGHTLRDKQEAEWLVGEMRRLSGLEQRAVSARGV
jgi:hypothetical protein